VSASARTLVLSTQTRKNKNKNIYSHPRGRMSAFVRMWEKIIKKKKFKKIVFCPCGCWLRPRGRWSYLHRQRKKEKKVNKNK
jgi:hypothetical protein